MTTFLILRITGGTGPPPTNNELTWQQQAIQVYNAMIARGYKQLAAEWKAFYPGFHRAHPQLTVKQVLSAFVGEVAAGAIAGSVGQAVTVLGKTPNAIAQGAENATSFFHNPLDYLKYPAEFLHALTEPQTWVRVAEVLIGAMLIYAGIRAATGNTGQSAVKGARNTGTIAGSAIRKITPTGRAASTIQRAERTSRNRATRKKAERIRQSGEGRRFQR